MESLTSPWSPAMLPDLTHPWSPPALPELLEPSPELLELFWPSMEQQEQMIDDLLDLESAVGHGPQMEHPQFTDADLDELVKGHSNQSSSSETNVHHEECYPAHDDAPMTPEFTDADLAELLKGHSNQSSSSETNVHREEQDQFYSATRNDAKEIEQTTSNHKIKICIKRSKLEACVLTLGVWGGRRQRKCRMRRTSWKVISNISGFQKPFACGHRKYTRKNNPHWTADEVDMLVDGLLRYGVGSWTKIKNAYFDTSIRTPVHLKDKWKNLREACGPEVRSKKKVKPQKATQNILQRMKGKIIKIETHAAQQRRA